MMAKQGKPLPFKSREEIKLVRQHLSIRHTARVLEVSRNTVRKYLRASLTHPQQKQD